MRIGLMLFLVAFVVTGCSGLRLETGEPNKEQKIAALEARVKELELQLARADSECKVSVLTAQIGALKQMIDKKSNLSVQNAERKTSSCAHKQAVPGLVAGDKECPICPTKLQQVRKWFRD